MAKLSETTKNIARHAAVTFKQGAAVVARAMEEIDAPLYIKTEKSG